MSESSRFDLVVQLFQALTRQYPTAYADNLLRKAEVMADHEMRYM